ncbi:MAG: PTS sugar transporter subunit IIA, partial [Oceanicaulis sp.]|nr:PTS sugar transporter subunit IIA [Oceanicaulis sp.]
MTLIDLIPQGGIVADMNATSRKQALHGLAELAQRTLNTPCRPVLDAVIERERLGSTGVGAGVGLPPPRPAMGGRGVGGVGRRQHGGGFDAGGGQAGAL